MRALAGLLLLALVGCGQGEAPTPEAQRSAGQSPPANHAGWTRLEDSPLSARRGAVAAFVDGRAVFVGGDVGRPCPPNADCQGPMRYAVDGAAYDPESMSWEPIRDAPRPIADHASHAVIGSHLFVRVGEMILDYAAARDRWTELDVPAGTPDWSTLTAEGHRLVLGSGSDELGEQPDLVLDTSTKKWSTLPDDPFALSFARSITATPAGLVLTTKAMDADGNPADPALVRAALLPRGSDRWTRLPDSDQLGGQRWVWTGTRMVDPTLGGADGGEVNGYGRTIPYGGRLDPLSGTWSRLPDAPEELTGGWAVEATEGPVVAAAGWLYDDSIGTWTHLPRPEGAPPEPGTAVWAGTTLLVLGGADWRTSGEPGQLIADEVYSTGPWAYRAG